MSVLFSHNIWVTNIVQIASACEFSQALTRGWLRYHQFFTWLEAMSLLRRDRIAAPLTIGLMWSCDWCWLLLRSNLASCEMPVPVGCNLQGNGFHFKTMDHDTCQLEMLTWRIYNYCVNLHYKQGMLLSHPDNSPIFTYPFGYKFDKHRNSLSLSPLDLVLNLKMSLGSDQPSLFLLWMMTSYSVDGVRP